MEVLQKVTMDLAAPGAPPRLDGVQGDTATRGVAIALTSGGAAWKPPSTVSATVRYRRSDGTGGAYSALPDGSSAWSVSGSTLTLRLAPQILTVPGLVQMDVTLEDGEQILSTFDFHLVVKPIPTGAPLGTYTLPPVLAVPEQAAVGQTLVVAEVDEQGKILSVATTEAGAADAAAVARKIVADSLLPIAVGGSGRENLFNPNDENVSMGYLASAGQVNNSDEYWVSGYMSAAVGDVVRMSANGAAKPFAYLAEYTSQNQAGFVTRTVNGSYYEHTITTAGYFRISVKLTAIAFDALDTCMVTVNSTDYTFTAYGVSAGGQDGLMSAAQAKKLASLTEGDSGSAKAPWGPAKFQYIAYSSVGIAPANSLEHFRQAAKQDYDMLKCDLRPTSDGKLIACHDAGFTLDSNGRITTFDESSCTPIHDLTYDACMALTYAEAYNGTFCTVCDLDGYLQICREFGFVPYLTVRDEYADAVAAALAAGLTKYGYAEQAVINSSDRDTLTAVRNKLPGVTLCIFCNPFGSSMASAYNYAVADGDCILSYYYTQSSHTWAEFTADSTVSGYIDRCNSLGIRQIACIESDNSHTAALVAMGFDGCHYMAQRPFATLTQETVQSMIDSALGGIENGTY